MRRAAALAALLFAVTSVAEAQPNPGQLRRLPIEELMQIDVTTASREPEPVRTAATAMSVITGEDIRHAGVTTIADALMLADGVHVARANPGAWSISARGFNGATPNKLVVMVDGRTVYSPLFAGVFWNTVDYLLENIDRIEVIRGPGAALWGANALNGSVNIITRRARLTTGMHVSVSSGNEDPLIVESRDGGISNGGTARVRQVRRPRRAAPGKRPAGRERRQPGRAQLVCHRRRVSQPGRPGSGHGRRAQRSLTARPVVDRLSGGSRVQLRGYYRREYDSGSADAPHRHLRRRRPARLRHRHAPQHRLGPRCTPFQRRDFSLDASQVRSRRAYLLPCSARSFRRRLPRSRTG